MLPAASAAPFPSAPCLTGWCPFSPDTPSSPSIGRVEPYSSSAQVEFDEPEATGGVPILKYKVEWRALGEGEWHSRLYDAKEGRNDRKTWFLPQLHRKKVTFP